MSKKTHFYGKFYIYVLIDPRDHKIFYLGRTKNAEKRLKQHIKESSKILTSKKQIIIKEIVTNNLYPILKILDSWTVQDIRDANRLEDAWIAKLKYLGIDLKNISLSRRTTREWYKTGQSKNPEIFIQRIKSARIKPYGNYVELLPIKRNSSKKGKKICRK